MQETITDFTVFYYHTIIQKKAKALNKNQKSKICKKRKPLSFLFDKMQ